MSNLSTIQAKKETRELIKQMAQTEGRTIYGLVDIMAKERLAVKYKGTAPKLQTETFVRK